MRVPRQVRSHKGLSISNSIKEDQLAKTATKYDGQSLSYAEK